MIIIDYRDHRPIYEQIAERFKELILKRVLEPDSQLPSVRSLAVDLSINPNTIQRAYAELERQGYTYSVKGKGNFIAAGDRLFQERQEEILRSMEELLREAKSIGITKEQVAAKLEECFQKGKAADRIEEGFREGVNHD